MLQERYRYSITGGLGGSQGISEACQGLSESFQRHLNEHRGVSEAFRCRFLRSFSGKLKELQRVFRSVLGTISREFWRVSGAFHKASWCFSRSQGHFRWT